MLFYFVVCVCVYTIIIKQHWCRISCGRNCFCVLWMSLFLRNKDAGFCMLITPYYFTSRAVLIDRRDSSRQDMSQLYWKMSLFFSISCTTAWFLYTLNCRKTDTFRGTVQSLPDFFYNNLAINGCIIKLTLILI